MNIRLRNAIPWFPVVAFLARVLGGAAAVAAPGAPAAEKVVMTDLLQVAVVVPDLQKAVEAYWDIFGVGPWRIHTTILPGKGGVNSSSVRLAYARTGNVGWELIQPLAGRNIYRDFLESKGGGFHHVTLNPVMDYDSALAHFARRGMFPLLGGSWEGSGDYACLDTAKDLHAVLEIFRPTESGIPGPESAPEAWYPAPPSIHLHANSEVLLNKIFQIGIVVRSIDRSMTRYWDILGLGPWRVHTYRPETGLTRMTIRGKETDYAMKLAMAYTGPMMWELIEPLSGPTIYADFLEQKGEGLHHVHCLVADYEKALTWLEKKGIGILMSGTMAQGSYAYLDTEKSLGFIIEIGKSRPPGIRPAVDAYYPR